MTLTVPSARNLTRFQMTGERWLFRAPPRARSADSGLAIATVSSIGIGLAADAIGERWPFDQLDVHEGLLPLSSSP